MKKVLGASLITSILCLTVVLQLGAVSMSQTGQILVGPPDIFEPANCASPILVPSQGPQPPAGPPCPPSQTPVRPPVPPSVLAIPPQPPVGSETCIDPNVGPRPHLGCVLDTPVRPAGPPLPPCQLSIGAVTSTGAVAVRGTIGVEMLLPPSYRVGSAPFLWIKTTSAAYVYVLDIDPQGQVFVMPGVQITSANSWHLFGEGILLQNPIRTDSINVVVSSSPLNATLEANLMKSQRYYWQNQFGYFILDFSLQEVLRAIGASYIYQGYYITN